MHYLLTIHLPALVFGRGYLHLSVRVALPYSYHIHQHIENIYPREFDMDYGRPAATAWRAGAVEGAKKREAFLLLSLVPGTGMRIVFLNKTNYLWLRFFVIVCVFK